LSVSASPTALKWAALHDAAGIVAAFAGHIPEPLEQFHNFPALIREPAGICEPAGWRTALAEQGIDDLAAIMEPGIAALLAVHERGAPCAAAAAALWREFAGRAPHCSRWALPPKRGCSVPADRHGLHSSCYVPNGRHGRSPPVFRRFT